MVRKRVKKLTLPLFFKKIVRIFKLKVNKMKLDYKLIKDIEFDGIDHRDYPDYCDAYIVRAEYNGEEMTEEQLELLNDDKDFVYEELMNYIF